MIEFKAWEKIPRGQHEEITITEKMDGTNAGIIIQGGVIVGTQSRKRLITPEDDNYGFSRWVEDNKDDLINLGEGYHYGEWTGLGIQKNPHELEKKEFFLFNSYRWNQPDSGKPECCKVVTILFQGESSKENINNTFDELLETAKHKPEGIVVWFHKGRRFEKYTYRDSRGKWLGKL